MKILDFPGFGFEFGFGVGIEFGFGVGFEFGFELGCGVGFGFEFGFWVLWLGFRSGTKTPKPNSTGR